ncbi:PKD domain-containing protein [Cellulomonas sp. URHB0016]
MSPHLRTATPSALPPGPGRAGTSPSRRWWGGLTALALAALVVGTPLAPAAAADPAPFTFLVIPDTQNYVSSAANDPVMAAQTQWVVDHRTDLNLAFVAGLGDIVGVESSTLQWQRASDHLAVLDAAGVPNSVVPGNHDMDLTTGQALGYQQFFPPSRYAAASWSSTAASYGGYLGQNQFGPDEVDRQNLDSYALFSASGLDFLVLNLEYNPPDAALAWARRVLAAYPQRRAILVTHSYVDVSGALSTQVLRADGGNSGQDLWDELVSTSCSIFLVVNGHFYDADESEARRTDTNACGRPVQAVLSDYQGRAHGGDGWLRYYTFDPAANQIRAVTYSPTLGRYETDDDSAFVLPYDMGGTTPPPPTPPLAEDTFARTLTGAWGAAETGGTWALTGGTARFTVAAGVGRQAPLPGGTVTANLTAVSSAATDLTTTFALDRIPDQALYTTVAGRLVGSGVYGARLKVLPGGAVQLHAERSGTVLAGGTLPGVVLTAGQRLHVRVQVQGTAPTTVRVRAWPDGVPEPSAWHATATDATAALQVPGGIRLSTYASAGTTGGAVTASFDDVLATTVGAPPPPPPVNQPPQAVSDATVSGLSVVVDSSASTDPDGTVTARSWAFGDGGTATGVTASHTYSAAGTYTVTLTVTDDDGATGTATRTVTVTAPPPAGGTLAADMFTRTTTRSWGTADAGGAWTLGGGTSAFSVAGGAGVLQVSPGATLTGTLSGVSSTATDAQATVSLSAVPDNTLYAALSGRVVGTADYAARVKVLVGGGVQLHLVRGGTALAGGTLSGLVLTPGAVLHVRTQAVGTAPTTLRARAWLDGTAEPAAWQYTATDATAALQAAGSVRLMTYLSGATTTGPVTARWDDLVASTVP